MIINLNLEKLKCILARRKLLHVGCNLKKKKRENNDNILPFLSFLGPQFQTPVVIFYFPPKTKFKIRLNTLLILNVYPNCTFGS